MCAAHSSPPRGHLLHPVLTGDVMKVLAHNLLHRVKSQPDDLGALVAGGGGEDLEVQARSRQQVWEGCRCLLWLCWPTLRGLLPYSQLALRTMNMLFHPLLTLATRASTIWLTQRMISSRISTARLWRMTTTKGRRKSFCMERKGQRRGWGVGRPRPPLIRSLQQSAGWAG